MYDSIVRNGTIIDGTGNDRFVADIAIKDGKIAKIGQITDPATNEIDAKGKLVTPGWVDIHTHYDGHADCMAWGDDPGDGELRCWVRPGKTR